MPPRESQKLLFHVREDAAAIADFTAGKTLDDYLTDRVLRTAVERQFEILGDELRELARADNRVAARITDCDRIIAFRDILIRGDAIINNRAVWEIVKTRLPVLRDEVFSLLHQHPQPR